MYVYTYNVKVGYFMRLHILSLLVCRSVRGGGRRSLISGTYLWKVRERERERGRMAF